MNATPAAAPPAAAPMRELLVALFISETPKGCTYGLLAW